MDSYYEDILKKVENLKQNQGYDECLKILEEELSMPYIPREYEERLIADYNECRAVIRQDDRKQTVYDEEDIADLLNGSLDEAFLAIEQLKKSNIRNHLTEIQDYLMNDPHYLVRSFLMEAMMEQNITDEITTLIDGLEVTFTPCYIEAPMESDGVVSAIELLREWFENEDPSFLMMCVESLVKEAYLKLPFNVEEDEAMNLAVAIVCYVFIASDNREGMELFLKEKSLGQYQGYELLLDKHEM
ncbi:hypothetical protein [[Eubacterium] hominis]|uniref:hypothetical protein n=1 Tax=[Eubacterium] hominis TaxID=2764325 RepID=UPI003A4E50F2